MTFLIGKRVYNVATIALQRSKKLLEKEGYHVWIVEVWHSFAGIRRDLYNMCDLTALRADVNGITGIQCCGENIQEHVQKILIGWSNIKTGKIYPPNPFIKDWLKAGNKFFIWGWRLRKHEGTRPTYQLREIEFLLENEQVINRENEVKP